MPWNPTGQSALVIMDRDGSNAARVPGLRGVHLPRWGGDGRVYFSKRVNGNDDIFSVMPDGQDLINHTDTPEIGEANVDVRGRMLVFDRPDGDDYVIELLDLDSGKRRVLRHGSTDWDATWLPGGDGLLVGVYPEPDAKRSVLTQVNLEGEVIRTWTPPERNVFWPTVSPDGETAVFSYSDQDFGAGSLFQLDLKSGDIRPLMPDRSARKAR